MERSQAAASSPTHAEANSALARWVLLLTAFAYAGIGVLFLGWPDVMGRVAGLEPRNTLALNDLRAVYGGLQLALATFFVIASRQPAWHPAALWLQMLTFGGLAAGRLLSLSLDGAPSALGSCCTDSRFWGSLAASSRFALCLGA